MSVLIRIKKNGLSIVLGLIIIALAFAIGVTGCSAVEDGAEDLTDSVVAVVDDLGEAAKGWLGEMHSIETIEYEGEEYLVITNNGGGIGITKK